jgi:hypothetical protein
MSDTTHFTVIFEGNLMERKDNPFKIDSPFGKVVGVGMGNSFDKEEALIDAIAYACDVADDGLEWLRCWGEGDPESEAEFAEWRRTRNAPVQPGSNDNIIDVEFKEIPRG